MRKLNGWQRIGVIGSVVWILGAYIISYNLAFDSQTAEVGHEHFFCESAAADAKKTEAEVQAIFRHCQEETERKVNRARSNARFGATVVALVPVPVGWGFVYFVLFLVRWVKRGFDTKKTAA